MNTKPSISNQHLAQLRSKGQQLQPLLSAEMPAVRAEWKQWASSLSSVVARHSKEIDEYIQAHGPMTREEVVEKALTKLLSEV
ncbi:MAG: hypothetical protein ACKVP0_19230 [Pirellulaceae bacterium]